MTGLELACPTFNVNDTSNATFEVLAAVTGRRHVIRQILISVGSDDTITVKRGSTTIAGPIYLAANSGISPLIQYPLVLKTGQAEALNITKGSSSTEVTAFGFHEED